MEKYIVRADFYPNGRIIPLGITDETGNTMFVNKIKDNRINSKNEFEFDCIIDEIDMLLIFKNGKWICTEKN